MSDVFTKQKRSMVMSRIRGKGNKSTEIKLLRLFRENGIKGWRRHAPLIGRPDFIFRNERLAVYVDGCFWHKCPKCYKPPKQNSEFWDKKISDNVKRDRKTSRALRDMGWSVCRIWECKLNNGQNVISKIKRMLHK